MLTGQQSVRIHRETHGTTGGAPLKAGIDEDVGKPLALGLCKGVHHLTGSLQLSRRGPESLVDPLDLVRVNTHLALKTQVLDVLHAVLKSSRVA